MTASSIPRVDQPRARFEARLRRRLLASDLERLLAEHRARPFGPHSDALARLLAHVRSAETGGKLAIYPLERDRRWALARIGAVARDEGSLAVDADATYDSLDAAEHAVFVARVAALHAAEAEAAA